MIFISNLENEFLLKVNDFFNFKKGYLIMKYYLFLFCLFTSSSSMAMFEDDKNTGPSSSLSAPKCNTDASDFPSAELRTLNSLLEFNAILENPESIISGLKFNFTPAAYQLSRLTHQLPTIRFLDLSGTDVSDDVILPLTALKNLEYLDLSSTDVRDVESVCNRRGHPNLSINLQYTLRNLSAVIPEGEFEGMGDTSIGGEVVRYASIKELKELYSILNDPRVQRISGFELNFPTTLKHLQHITTRINMKNLTLLGLRGSALTDISTLGTLEELLHLDLSSTGITDLSHLAMFKKLRELYLKNTAVSDISPLAELVELLDLDLSNSPITNINPLTKLTRLERLDLSNTAVSNIEPLAYVQRLKWVDLSGTYVTDVSLLYVKNWLTFFSTNVGNVTKRGTTAKDVSRQLEEYRGNIHRTLFEHLWLKYSSEIEVELILSL